MALLGFPLTQQQTVNDPQQSFVWGQGGRRMTPEDIAMQRQLAEQQRMAGADFSPVGSVWEGLGRVVQGYSGGLADRRATRAQDANAAESQSIAELLMGQGESAPDNNAVLQALVNPYVSDEVRQLAGMQYQRMNPDPVAPTEFARLQAERDALPVGSPQRLELDQYIAGKADPLITATLPGDRFFSGPQSQLATFLQGGAPPVSPPDRLPADFDFGEPEMSVSPMELDALVREFGPQEVQSRLDSGRLSVRGR